MNTMHKSENIWLGGGTRRGGGILLRPSAPQPPHPWLAAICPQKNNIKTNLLENEIVKSALAMGAKVEEEKEG